MFLKSIHPRNLLSFGPDSEALELRGLNVLIGANGSGKSNLLEVIGLLKAAPENLAAPIKEAGGVKEWLWRHDPAVTASIDAVVDHPEGRMPLRHRLEFGLSGSRFELRGERIENERPKQGHESPYEYYQMENGVSRLRELPNGKSGHPDESRAIKREFLDPERSILSQIRDPEHYPKLTYFSLNYSSIRIYRDWVFGRYTPPRLGQRLDRPNGFLDDQVSNLALVVADILPFVEDQLVSLLKHVNPAITGIHVKPLGESLQLYVKERGLLIPATRLSDGTLRYLCLLVILLHPAPVPLICIDEPELGLHPDALPYLAELLVDASERTQLIVTTHSELLVDSLTRVPESLVVVENSDQGTQLRRLQRADLEHWLENHSLADLWGRGYIGGNSR